MRVCERKGKDGTTAEHYAAEVTHLKDHGQKSEHAEMQGIGGPCQKEPNCRDTQMMVIFLSIYFPVERSKDHFETQGSLAPLISQVLRP